MIRLLKFLWTGSWHEHKCETIKSINVYEGDKVKGDIPSKLIIVMRCTGCGEFKKFKIKA